MIDKKNIILIAIVILVIALAAVAAFIYTSDSQNAVTNTTNKTENKTVLDADKVNTTIVGDNSTRTDNNTNNTNTTYKVYNPQSDTYVPVIGEKFDQEVNRWYTYDQDGVRYYNTRIN